MATKRALPPPPQTQALQSKTFRPPPLDGSLKLPEIYDWHAENTPNHRLFVFCDENQQTKTILWPEAVKAIYNGAQFLRMKIGEQDSAPIVAILAMADTITYFTMLMAIIRAGYIAFPISPRNSPSAVAHLISSVGVHYILVGNDQSMIDLANESLQSLKENYRHKVTSPPQLFRIPNFEDLFVDTGDDFKTLPAIRKGSDDIIIYLHSSGSTAYPKPIPWTNYRFMQLSLIPFFGERDLTNQVFSLHSMPMYHGMGILQLCWTASCGLVVSAFEPKSPAQIPTPENLFQGAVGTESDIIFCVPAIIEAWSRNPEYIKWLATRVGVLFGGGPLNKTAGDYMTSQGVSIFILYGSTESWIMSPILPAQVGYDWDYFRFPNSVKAEMVPYGDNTFEFVMVSNPYCRPSVINTKVDNIDAYATSDLMTPHPTKPGYWRIYGKTDDQIMHNTGEKTNPGPLENMLNQDPHVQSSVMFGRGMFQAGVIIDPKPAFKFDPSNEAELANFRNKIWQTIQKMNKFAPQHSRLFKEMVLVAKPDKPFQYTAKSTARRQAIINQYEDEIEAVYGAVEATTQSSILLPKEWDIISATNFVRSVISSVLIHEVKDDDDIFQHGCDSLQATWIRNTLTRALRDGFQLDTRKNVDNFVYEYPSISSLAAFLVAHISGNHADKSSNEAKEQDMLRMVEKYSHNFPAHISRIVSSSVRKTVLLTGSTGGLGAFIFNSLVADEDVERIYCVNRPTRAGAPSLLDRQRVSLVEKELPKELMESKKMILLEGRLEEPQSWALDKSVYDEMQYSITHIIHNAWPVDFNLALTSFEANIMGVRNLINFALSSPLPSPPTLIYTSTIGVFQTPISAGDRLPEVPIEAKVAIGTGYTESKWVSEKILEAASSQTSLKAIVVRVGQISGGPNGFWNTKEWFPALVQSAKFVFCLPNVQKDISWIPIQAAAEALVDFMESSESGIAHLVHPRSVPWSKLATAITSELSAPLVPYHEWLSKLEHMAILQERNLQTEQDAIAASRLLNFYRNIALKKDGTEHFSEAFGFPALSTEFAVKNSSTLVHLKELSDEEVKSWLTYWRTAGFM
ncbi:acetyl-CoA synthetase-like protein [Pholiota conissans]|uniref:Acetyl-CoA synthetase-like protein n=1 Tax=Pholiota conissans TaxID=109636 RepID=A0A9P5YKE5_9AGAR|nr:acetyl-CoA synthetase-like protein [Pholiota conissans]